MKVALVLLTDPVGPLPMIVLGRAVSTTNVCDAGVGSGAPHALSARTSNVCVPSDSGGVGVCGDVQPVNVAVSTRHWKPGRADSGERERRRVVVGRVRRTAGERRVERRDRERARGDRRARERAVHGAHRERVGPVGQPGVGCAGWSRR